MSDLILDNTTPPFRYLGPLVIGDVLARGVRTTTYAARDPATDRRAVVKVLSPRSGAGASAAADAALFRLVGEVLAATRHPNLLPVFDVVDLNGSVCMIAEQVDGETLAAAVGGDRWPGGENAVRGLIVVLLDGLYQLHVSGIIHRDIKPANIMLRADGTPLLVDFDAALPTDCPVVAGGAGAGLLTPGFAAPEQYQADGDEGPWTDLYGLGAVAYWLVTGRAPPEAPARRDGDTLQPAADAARGRYSEPLLRSIDRALALHPAARPQTAKGWALTLKADRPPAVASEEPTTAAAVVAVDDIPPTVIFERVAAPKAIAAIAVAGGAFQAAQRRRGRRTLALAAAAFLILAPLAAWRGWEYYLAHIKSEWSVDGGGGGDVRTIGEALSRARDGAVIRVRPGRYAESLAIERQHRLEGDGETGDIVVAASSLPCLRITAAGGVVRGLSLVAAPTAAADGAPCVDVAAEGALIEGNIVANGGGPAIRVSGTSDAVIRDNSVVETGGTGIVVEDSARPLIVGNEIVDSGKTAIKVHGTAAPQVTGNQITGARQSGILVAGHATGIVRDNAIAGTRLSGIEVRDDADPQVTGNRIEASGQAGIYVHSAGRGRFANNTVTGSAYSGVVVGRGADPMIEDNQISGNREHGILLLEGGKGRLQDNAVTGNGGHGIARAVGAATEVLDNTLKDNREPQAITGEIPSPTVGDEERKR